MKRIVILLLSLAMMTACGSEADGNETNVEVDGNKMVTERDPLPFESETVVNEYKSKTEDDSIASVVNDDTHISMIDGDIYDVSILLQSITNEFETDINHLTDTIAKELKNNGYLTREYTIEGLIINVLAVDRSTINLTIFKEGD